MNNPGYYGATDVRRMVIAIIVLIETCEGSATNFTAA